MAVITDGKTYESPVRSRCHGRVKTVFTLALLVGVSVIFSGYFRSHATACSSSNTYDDCNGIGAVRVIGRSLKSVNSEDTPKGENTLDLSIKRKSVLESLYVNDLNSSLELDSWNLTRSTIPGFSTNMPCLNSSNGPRDAGRIYCDMKWDGLSCWPATPGGQYSIIACPIMHRIDVTKNASKFCYPNGTWEGLANYNSCIAALSNPPEEEWTSTELDSDYAKRIIYNLGFTMSTLALGIALFIFLYFRSLRCLRNKIHCQLIITFILRNVLWILMQHTLLHIVASEHMWACKLETSIFNYVQMTNFFWMLVEGMYLHIIIVWTYSADKIKLWYFMVIGWGIPAIIIVVWVSLRIHFQKDLDESSHLIACWMSTTNGNATYIDQLDWIYNGPILFVLATNMLFLATIIWVLVTKLRASHSLETRQLRKAVKATLLLFPLLGIIYVLFIWPLSDAPAVVEAHEFINAVLQSFQGFFVALFYCFLNGEVKAVLKKKFSVFQDSRSLSARYTKSTIGWANDTSIAPKEGIVLTNGHLSPQNNGARHGSPWNTPTLEHHPEETENML